MAAPAFALASDLTAEVNPAWLGFPLPDYWPGTNYITVISPDIGAEIASTRAERNGVTTQRGFTSPEDEYDAVTTTRSSLSLLLLECALTGEPEVFAGLVADIDWSARRADEISSTIDLALSMEMAPLAIDLAQVGGRLYPDDLRLQRAARVLAPPVARVVRSHESSGLTASRSWLQNHAVDYSGLWLAVRDGQLLGAAGSFAELRALVDLSQATHSTIVTKVA